MKKLLYLKDDQLKDLIEKLFISYRETFSDSKNILNKIKTVKTLNDLVKISKDILAGKIKGRILIKV